jgi:carbonic anhydrase
MRARDEIERLKAGNEKYVNSSHSMTNTSKYLRTKTAKEGQKPLAIVIACSDSRVMPNSIFSVDLGELFVIRVAGNVLDNHQIGSIEYAVAHLHVNLIVMLGHTGCGAVAAAIRGEKNGYVGYITEDICEAIGDETDDYKATVLNVEHGVNIIKKAFSEHPEIDSAELVVKGAVYNIETGVVDWVG